MKKLLLLLSVLFPCALLAQGVIIGFYTIPPSPTVNDNVKVVAELSFTSGDCPLSNQGHSTSGDRTDGYALHCLGFLTVICTTTDTFSLGNLPAGDHTFVLTLSSGFGSNPCSPGIVPDDRDSITFTVDPGVGISSPETHALNIAVYPNPASSSIVVDCGMRILNCELKITNTIGQVVYQSAITLASGETKSEIDVSALSSGLYYLTLQSNEGVAVKKFEVVR